MSSYALRENQFQPSLEQRQDTERVLGIGCSQRICRISDELDDAEDSELHIDALTENSMMDHPEAFDLVDVFARNRRGGKREW